MAAHTNKLIYDICKYSALLALKVVVRLSVSGVRNIPARGAFILASNHASFLDPPVLAAACPRRLHFMARDSLFKNKFFAWLVSSCGAIPLRRDSADRSALKECIRSVRGGNSLLVFPEGRRRTTGEGDLTPRAGVGFLAAKLGVPVIPALVKGTEQALPKGGKKIRPCRVSVYFGTAVPLRKGMEYQEIADTIMRHIRRLPMAGIPVGTKS